MSVAKGLFKKPEVRQVLMTPISSMGFFNVIKSVRRARKLNEGDSKDVARYLFPEVWKGLGDRKAVVSSTGTTSFAELSDRAIRMSNSLYQQGMRQGDRVAVLSANEQAWFDTMTGCMVSDLSMPMLNIHLKPDELKKCINNCAPRILVFSAEYLEKIKGIEAELTSIELFICSANEEEKNALPENYIALNDFISKGEAKLEEGGFTALPQMAFSGGSTGVPKFIIEGGQDEIERERRKGLSKEDYQSLQVKLYYGLAKLGVGKVKGKIVSLVPGPLYHAGVQTAVLPLLFGATIVPMRKFDAEKYLQLVEEEKANYTFVAPTMLERILKLPDDVKSKYDLSSMQIILCAAAPCADYVKIGINKLFKQQGAKVNVFHEYYGSSESAIITVLSPEDYEEKPERYKSVGKVTGSDCMVYNPEEGRICAPGEEGHVVVRNARMYTINYGGNTEMNDAFIEIDGVYWFDDGCLGHLDEDNFLYLTSRSKDMIISGGVNVFPVEIEEVLKQHESIMDAAVIKVADADMGEVGGALIQTVSGDTIPDQEIIDFCKEKGLYGFKLPKHIKFIDKLPKNDAGKIRKKDLEGEFAGSTPVAVVS